MHLTPDANQIAKVAESIGAHIGEEEAAHQSPIWVMDTEVGAVLLSLETPDAVEA